jgi:hypothetical protein
MIIGRRGFLAGLGALVAAPAVIRIEGLLMPIKPVVMRPALRIRRGIDGPEIDIGRDADGHYDFWAIDKFVKGERALLVGSYSRGGSILQFGPGGWLTG